jgi:hypothetical protein
MASIVVAGALAAKPGNGGEAWVRLSWVLGLRRLGFDVWLLEEADSETAARGQSFFERTVARHGLTDRAVLMTPEATVGTLSRADLEELAGEAAALVNISGNLRDPALLGRFANRAYIDLDPGFTQLWQLQGLLGDQLESHDRHFTVALNIGGGGCEIPTAGIDWVPLPPPVLIDSWTPPPDPRLDRFTTVASWRNALGRPEIDGHAYSLKHHQLRRFSDLPSSVAPPLEIALDIHPDETEEAESLRRAGWSVADAASVTGDTDSFRDYVRGSGAEFSVTQGIYAETRSGWISDRTAHYLACGRPAVVQDTGIPSLDPAQDGMLVFSEPAEAAAAIEAIAGSYSTHSTAARDYAERNLDSDRVLTTMLEAAGVG